MSKSINNYIDYLSKEKNTKNFPKTPSSTKNNYNKEDRIPFQNPKSRSGSMNKNKTGNSNSKKKYKIYSNSIIDQDNKNNKNNNNLMYKNFCSKNILNINNACNNGFSHKNNNSIGNIKDTNYNYSNISSNNFYSKKINDILNYDNPNKNNNIKINTDANHINFINKTQSIIHNNINNTSKNTKNVSSKKILNYMNNSNSRPTAPVTKIKDDNNYKNKGRPMSLLEISNNQKKFNNSSSNNNNQISPTNNNIHINKTQFNNYNNLNSNHFVKRNILSNITYTNDINFNNNLVCSYKNDSNPKSMKYQIPKKSQKNKKNGKEIKKSQSQSHFNCKISHDITQKKRNNKMSNSKSKKKSGSKNKLSNNINNNNLATGSYKRNDGLKNKIKSKKMNYNLNMNNINNFNKFLFSYNSLLKSSSQKKSHINVKYPVEESKELLNYNHNNNNIKKINKSNNYIEDNLSEDNYKREPIFNDVKSLWDELGGVNPDYEKMFFSSIKEYENKNIIVTNEINELISLINNLKKLNNDIKTRNDIINKIKKMNNNNFGNIDNIKNLLISLRMISIDVVNDYILFLKEISYDIMINKFDIHKIKNFNKNYLNDMTNDTNFLVDNIYLNQIFYFSKNDPFLISPGLPKSKNAEKNNYLILPIENNIFQKINKCQYILLKEKIGQKIIQVNNNKNILNNMLYNNKNYLLNNNQNINTNKCINSYNIINNNVNNNQRNNSQFNISNTKSENFNNRSCYNCYKCNDFCYINNSNSKTNIENNNKKNEINKVQESTNIINNQRNNNNAIENIPKNIQKSEDDAQKEINNNNSTDFNLSPVEVKSKSKITNLISDNLQIIPYDFKKDSDLSSLYLKYLSSISDNMKQSFNINNDIFYYSTIGIFPKILLLKDDNSYIQGICTLSFNENINLNRKILIITSISCTKGYKISKFLLNLLDFCKNKEISFDSIEINLYYIKDDGKFILDEGLEKEIKAEAKFKWVRLENDGEKRKIKYHYIPKNENTITNKENSILNNMNSSFFDSGSNKCAISINNYALIKYYEQIGINDITMIDHSKIFFIINLLKNYYLLDDNNDEQEIENILNDFKGLKLKKIIRILSNYNNVLETNSQDFKNDYCNDDNYNIELLYLFLEIIEKHKNENNEKDFLYLNFNNIYTNFSNIIKIEIDGYEYNIISMNDYIIEVFNIDNNQDEDEDMNNFNNFNIYENSNNNDYIMNNQNNDKIETDKEMLYFTKSEDENISFIFYEIKENNNKKNNDINYIKLLFNKILKKILIKDSEQPIKSYKKICIPSFTYKKRNNDKENKLENENDKLQLMKCDIWDFQESFDFCIENLSCKDIKYSFPLNKNINDDNEIKIIKNNFVVAVLNPDLILDYHLPSMNIYYISKDKWIKSKK